MWAETARARMVILKGELNALKIAIENIT